MLVEVGLKQQRGIAIALVGIIMSMSVETSFMMDGTAENEGDVRPMLRIENEGILGKSLIALVGDVNGVGVRSVW